MKLPSFDKLLRDATATLIRFPLVILAGIFSTCVIWTHTEDFRYTLVGILGISFLYAIAMFVERRLRSKVLGLVAGLAGVGLLVLYLLCMPDYHKYAEVEAMRFFLFAVGAHLLAAFAPFTGRNELNGFWQYNKTLFIRILSTGLYTGVLYLGLSLALLAIHQLFNVEFGNRVYGDLGGFLAGVFATWFFLAGVPSDTATLEGVNAYPNGLKIFTQYVLLPLVSIYLVILYLYAGKIVLAWELPTGWVSGLILGLSVLGILSLLLLYPIRNLEGNAWIRRFNAWFYWLLIPLIVLLFLAIGRRVGDYNITEPRYFVLALAVWLAAITVYFIISKRDNIKAIPISLAAVAVLASFGPWGAFEVSVRSQLKHFQRLLTETKGLVGGKFAPIGDTLKSEDANELRSIIRYLESRHRLGEVRDWVPGSPAVVSEDTVYASLHLGGLYPSVGNSTHHITISVENRSLFHVDGFSDAFQFSTNESESHLNDADNASMRVFLRTGGRQVVVHAGNDSAVFDIAAVYAPIADSAIAADSTVGSVVSYLKVSPERLVVPGTLRGKPARILMTSLEMTQIKEHVYGAESIDGMLLFGEAEPPAHSAP